MPKVLIIGATGYIGLPLAKSLLRSGSYTVYGLARTPTAATTLSKHEITAVLSPDPVNNPSDWASLLNTEMIETVIDVSGAGPECSKFLDALLKAAEERKKSWTEAGWPEEQVPRLGYVYASGTWVHGDQKDTTEVVDEYDVVGTKLAKNESVKLTAWRPGFEREVLAANGKGLNTLVVRPVEVFGGSSWLFNSLFGPIQQALSGKQGSVEIQLNGESTIATVHVDDVVAGFHAAVSKLPALAGSGIYRIFNLATGMERLSDIAGAFAKHSGYSGEIKFVGFGDNIFFSAISTSGNIDSGRAKEVFGWEPKRPGFVKRMDLYAPAWKAHQEQGN